MSLVTSKWPKAPLPQGCTIPANVRHGPAALVAFLTLKVLRSVEVLLLLQEVNIAHQRNTSNGLAVCRVRQRNPIVIGVVGRTGVSKALDRGLGTQNLRPSSSRFPP